MALYLRALPPSVDYGLNSWARSTQKHGSSVVPTVLLYPKASYHTVTGGTCFGGHDPNYSENLIRSKFLKHIFSR